MTRQIPVKIFAICMTVLTAVSGCSGKGNVSKSSEVSKSKEKSSEQKKFDRYLMNTFTKNVSENGINLHYTLENPEKYGIKNQKKNIGKICKKDIISGKIQAKKELEKVKEFEYSKLSYGQQDTYDVLFDYMKQQEKLASYPYYQTILSPVSGVQTQLLISFCEYRLNTKDDIESYFQLLSQTESYFESVISYEKERIKRGLFMTDDAVDAAVEQIYEFTDSKNNNSLIETFKERIRTIDGLSQTQKDAYICRNGEIVTEQVIPAYERLAQKLKTFKGNGKNLSGLSYLNKGRDYYELLVQSKTGSSKSVKEMISMTEENIKKCIEETSAICKKYPDIYEEYANLNIKPYTGSNPERIIEKLKKKTKKYYPKAPKVNCKIKYVHKSMEKNSSPAFYMIPAIDSYKDNVIYINKIQMKDFNQIYSTLAHEGYPGHLYQNVYYAARKESSIRYILDYPGYSEGWATYVEGWSYSTIETGKNRKILARLNVIGMEFNLALCSRVDFGVHYEGWTKKETEEYLSRYGIDAISANNIFSMIVREPANYLSYYIGYREFLELNDYYKKRAGKKYNLKTFHTMMLDAGPCSFDILKKRIRENLRMEE